MPESDMQVLLSSLPPSEHQTLLACAVLPWFDEAALAALLANPEQSKQNLAAVRAHLQVTSHSNLPGCSIIEDAQRQELLRLLQNQFPDLYRLYHRRAVVHLGGCVQAAEDAQRQIYQNQLMSLLETLFRRYMNLHEVIELNSVLTGAVAVPLDQPEHRRLLTYYRACVDNELGDYDTAESSFIQLLAQSDLQDYLRARALTALGINLNYREQFDRAIDAYQQSGEAHARLGNRLGEATALSNVGIIHSQLGRYEQAIPVLETSYSLAAQIDDLFQCGRALNELGLAAKELGRWDAALDYYRRALDIWRQLGNRASQGRIYNNVGEVYFLTGRWEEAELNFEQALAIALHPEVDDKRQAADMLHNLGLLSFCQNQPKEAQARYEDALRLSRAIESAAAVSLVCQRLGQLWESQGQLRKAFQAYRRAIDAVETLRGQVKRQDTKISLLGTRQHPYEAMVLLCCKLGWFAKAFHYAERARARAFLDLLASSPARANGRVKLMGSSDPAKADQGEEPLTLRQVCRSLPADTALLVYFTTGILDWGDGVIQNLPAATKSLRTYLMPPACTLVFVITRSGMVERRDLAVDPNTLRPSPTDNPSLDPRFLESKKLRRLYDLLLAPVWDKVHNRRVLYIIPHGPLHYLPFGALRHPDGRCLMHADHPQLAYAPSATVLLRHCCGAPSAAARTCLAFGYNGQGSSALCEAEEEAQVIARVWNGDVRAGNGPKKMLLKETGKNYRMLHFACHGQFTPHNALGSFLAIGADERLTAAEIIEDLKLDADLVILSACQSGVSHIARGDELVGLIRAFMSAGASSLVVTQWHVTDVSTRIAMEQFHQNLAAGMGKAESLQKAQLYLQALTLRELKQGMAVNGWSEVEIASQAKELLVASGEDVDRKDNEDAQVFAHPRYWAPFILVGEA